MRWRSGIGLGLLAAVGLVWTFWPTAVNDPVVRGKRLSVWLDERRQPAPVGPITLSVEATVAVRSLGPEAVPTLLAWLRLRDSGIVQGSQLFLRPIFGSASGLRGHDDERTRAALGLQTLGEAGRAAWPAIVEIVLRGDHEQSRAAMFALYDADAEAARLLVPAAMSDPVPAVRGRAMQALRLIPRAAAEVALPTLERLRTDPNSLAAAEAAGVLSSTEWQLRWLLPNLKHPDPDIRRREARFLGGHGHYAQRYLPDLEAAADDPDPNVRAAVAEAILQVQAPAP